MTDIIVILYTVGDYVKKKRNMQKCQMGAKFTMKRAVKASLSFYCMAMTAAAAFFSEQVPVLERYYTVYLVDSRGHGRSTNEASMLNFQLMAEDLNTIMLLEKIDQADFLGFSDGANLALVFASSFPKKFID